MLVFLLNIISSVRKGRPGQKLDKFRYLCLHRPFTPLEEKGGNKPHIHYFLYAWANQVKDSQDSSHSPTVFSVLPFISLSFSYTLEINVSLFLSTGPIHFHRRLIIMVPCPLNWKGSRSTTYIVC